jgi:hypothetical protein
MTNERFKERFDAFLHERIEHPEPSEWTATMQRGEEVKEIIADSRLVATTIHQIKQITATVPAQHAFEFAMTSAILTGFLWGREFGATEGSASQTEIAALEKLFVLSSPESPDPDFPRAA